MSRTIDERVVQMTFNNGDFERNAKTTINTLGQLKNASDVSALNRGLQEVGASARKLDFGAISNAVLLAGQSMSTFEKITTGMLLRIGEKVADTGVQLAKNLSIGQIQVGWGKYAERTQSVQTLVNSTGKSVEEIEKYLSKLMWYSDETSFGFTDMTSALATMVSSGGNIDKLIPMIEGIGNATAYAGKGAAEFKRVIYNLNQSYSSGALTLMDWKSVENAGASSKALKQVLISTAEELGTIKKGAIAIGDFNSSLSKKWVTSEVMEKGFTKFAEVTEAAYKLVDEGKFDLASDAIEYLAGKYDEIAERAFRSAQEAKSFTEAIEATKDAVSSGWMQSFSYIFGNYDEAKELWTALANEMWEWFASGAEARNEILKQWHEGVSTFQKQVINEETSNLNDIIDTYEDLIKTRKKIFDPLLNEITMTEDRLSIGKSMITRDTSEIGKAISEVYDKNEDYSNIRWFFQYGSLNESDRVIKLLEERNTALEKLGESEEDEIKRLEIIEKYYKLIGDAAMDTSTFRSAGSQFKSENIKKTEKSLEFQTQLYDLLKAENLDRDAIAELFTSDKYEQLNEIFGDSADGIRYITDELERLEKQPYKNKEAIKALKDELVDIASENTEAWSVGGAERGKKIIEDLRSAVENKDREKLFEVWKNGSEVLLENIELLPKKIVDIQDEIDALTKDDYFTNRISDYEERIKSASGAEKKRLEGTKALLEGLNEAIRNDNIVGYFKDSKEEMTNYFKDFDGYKEVFDEIKRINNDSTLTSEERKWYLENEYDLLAKIVKEQSKLDEATEKQKDLEKELVDYFIEGKSGYDIMIGAVKNILTNITNVLDAIRKGFGKVFNVTPVGLINLTQRFADFIDNISLSKKQLETLSNVAADVFGILSNVLQIFKPIYALIETTWSTFITPLAYRFAPIFEDVFAIFQNLSKIISNTANDIAGNMSPVQRFFADVLNTFEPLIRIVQSAINWFRELTDSWINGSQEIAEETKKDTSFISTILGFLQKIFTFLEKVTNGLQPFLEVIGELAKGAFGFLGDTLKKMFEGLNSVLKDNDLSAIGFGLLFKNIIGSFSLDDGSIKTLSEVLEGAWEDIKKAVETFVKKLGDIPKLFDTVKQTLDENIKALKAIWSEEMTATLKNLSIGILAIAAALLIISTIPEDALDRSLGAIVAIGGVMAGLLTLLDKLAESDMSEKVQEVQKKGFGALLSKFLTGLGGVFAVFGNILGATEEPKIKINDTVQNIIAISAGMVIIAGALKWISTISENDLSRSLGTLLTMMIAMYAFLAGLSLLDKKSDDKSASSFLDNAGVNISRIAGAVFKVSFGLILVAAALKLISTIGETELFLGVAALSGMLLAIGLFITAMSKIKLDVTNEDALNTIGKAVAKVGFGLILVAGALKIVSTIGDPAVLVNSIAALSFMLLAVGVFMSSMAKVEGKLGDGKSLLKIASSIMVLSIAIGAIVAAIAVMSMIPVGSLAKSVVFMGLALAEIWGFSKLMSKVGNGSTDLLSIAAAMLIFSTALIALGGALAIIGSLNEESLGKSLISIMLAMAGIGVIAAIFSNPTTVAAVYAFSVAFVAIGAAVFLVATGISQLLPLLMLLSTQSASVSEGIQMTLITTFETILGLIPDFVLGAVGALLEFVGLLVIGLAEKVPELLDGFALFLNELANGIRASAGTIGAALGNLAAALIEGIVTALYEAGKSLLGGLWDWIVGDSGLDGEALTQQMAVKMGTAGAEGGEALTSSLAETLQNQNQEAIDAAANGVGDEFTNTLIENFANSSGSVSNAADSLGDTAASAMENRSGANSAAYNTVSGYTSFLTSGTAYGMVSGAFSGLGTWGIQALKNALGIKSPSRVMAEQGMYSVLGLVNGVYDNLDSVDQAGTDTANVLLNAMQYAADNAESILEDDMNPVITPVLDLSNLEENSGAISSLLNNGASYQAALAVQQSSVNPNIQNGALKPLSVNVSFTINEAGKGLTEEDFSRFGRQIANIVNQELGGMI